MDVNPPRPQLHCGGWTAVIIVHVDEMSLETAWLAHIQDDFINFSEPRFRIHGVIVVTEIVNQSGIAVVHIKAVVLRRPSASSPPSLVCIQIRRQANVIAQHNSRQNRKWYSPDGLVLL